MRSGVAGAPEGSVEGIDGAGLDAGGGEGFGQAGDHGHANGSDVGEDASGEGDRQVRVSGFEVRGVGFHFPGYEGDLEGEVGAGAVEDGGGEFISLLGAAGDDGSQRGEVGGGADRVAAVVAEVDEFGERVEVPVALDFEQECS